MDYIANCLPTVKRPRCARERFLLPEEWQRLRTVLDGQPPKVRVYFYLLVLEGPRMSEARYMQWAHVDLTAGLWFKPKTKNGKAQLLPLSEVACALLDSLPRDAPYVFHGEAGHTGTKPGPWCRTAVFFYWSRIRQAAQLPGVQIRDLRRTMASMMAINGENLGVIQHVLNHSSLQPTMVYARYSLASERAALNRHAGRMVMALAPRCAQTLPP